MTLEIKRTRPEPPPRKVRSWKTTYAGLITGAALVLTVVADSMADGKWDTTDTSLVVAALAIALQGLVSRDDDVTSEGTKRSR